MKTYWKVTTPYHRKDADLASIYVGGPRFFWKKEDAQARTDELNKHHAGDLSLGGTFHYVERTIKDGVFQDADARDLLPPE